MSSRMDAMVDMARTAAEAGKRTLICVATRERAVAVREEYGLVGHALIMVVAIDPPLHYDELREVSFVSYENVRAIPADRWSSLEQQGEREATEGPRFRVEHHSPDGGVDIADFAGPNARRCADLFIDAIAAENGSEVQDLRDQQAGGG